MSALSDPSALALDARPEGGLFLLACGEALRRGQRVRFQAAGMSMRPVILDGDVLTVVPVASRSPRIGDIVLYEGDGRKVFVHRILFIRSMKGGRIFFIRGDTCAGGMDSVAEERVLGRVAMIERKGRRLRADSPWRRLLGLLMIAASPVAVYLLPVLKRCRAAAREKIAP